MDKISEKVREKILGQKWELCNWFFAELDTERDHFASQEVFLVSKGWV